MKVFATMLALLTFACGAVHAAPGGLTTTFATVERACDLQASVTIIDPNGVEYDSDPLFFCPGIDNFVAIDDVIPGAYTVILNVWTRDEDAVSRIIQGCSRFFDGEEVTPFNWERLEDADYNEILVMVLEVEQPDGK